MYLHGLRLQSRETPRNSGTQAVAEKNLTSKITECVHATNVQTT